MYEIEYNYKMKTYPKLVASSANPENLSLTIKGIILMLVPFAVELAGNYGYAWTDNDLIQVIEGGWLAASTFIALYGAFRKLLIKTK